MCDAGVFAQRFIRGGISRLRSSACKKGQKRPDEVVQVLHVHVLLHKMLMIWTSLRLRLTATESCCSTSFLCVPVLSLTIAQSIALELPTLMRSPSRLLPWRCQLETGHFDKVYEHTHATTVIGMICG